ncbi:MAG: MATE family efflux transporter [Gemmatimonadota bacterium]
MRRQRINTLDSRILALALPALGALAADPLVSLVDTLFVGRLGTVPLAALGVNAAVFAMAFVVFNFLAYGTTPLVARAVGGGEQDSARHLSVQALTLAVVIGVGALAGLELAAGPVLRVMGAEGELFVPARTYLRIRALAGPAVLLITASHGIFRGYQDTRTPLLVTLWLNVVNLVLDPILIFGLGWGLAGAAWATAVAQWSGAIWFLSKLGRAAPASSTRPARPRIVLDFQHFRHLRGGRFMAIGGALAVRTFALIGTLTMATAVATRIGTVSVAAHQVGSQLWLLLALAIDSLAVAAQALVAHFRGEKDLAAVHEASNRILLWGLGTGTALAGLLWLLSPLLPHLFTDEPEVIRAVAEIMPFIIWMQPLNALVFVWDGIFIGAEDFRFLAAQMVASGLVAAAALILVAVQDWDLVAVWWALVLLMAMRAGTLAARYFGLLGNHLTT